MTVRVDLVLEPGLATVRRRPGRWSPSPTPSLERFRDPDTAALVATAVRRARMLRTLRRVDLRIVLETADVILRPRHDGARAGSGIERSNVTGPPAVALDDLDIVVPSDLVEAIASGLRRRRCTASVRMHLGVLLRTHRLLTAVGEPLRQRPGVIVDVRRPAVSVLELDGGRIRAARCAPASDVVAALSALAVPAVRRRAAAEGGASDGGRVWLHLSVPRSLAAGVRDLCASALPPGSSVDLVALGDAPHAR